MKTFKTYEEAFLFWLKNRAESPELEQAEAAKDLILSWLRSADDEVNTLRKEAGYD